MATEITCSAFSLDVSEALYGTAKPTEVYFLLEYNERWEPEAFEDSSLPAPVKTHLAALLDTIPQARILLIRQKPRRVPTGIAFYVALTRERDPRLFAFSLARYEDLLALDIPALLADPAAYEAQRHSDPIALVCTHGRRDACCARHGVPVYEALSAQMGAGVWQTSHVGGHRFAANVLYFPHGLVYGRVTPENVHDITADYLDGRLVPGLLRGRAVYEPLVQAAEVLLRLETGITGLDALRLIHDQVPAPGVVRFAGPEEGTVHTVEVAADPAGVHIYGSCGDDATKAQAQYRLVRHTVEQA